MILFGVRSLFINLIRFMLMRSAFSPGEVSRAIAMLVFGSEKRLGR